ncbi:DUF6544 family protein [Nonomuraea basaltis]|uniref:DUF6544 family protein n=1 Tax=Nonomuraea basaltis TaxID=2495887 RepID=UPI001F105F3D|nr:DUF6544 family protein [Nonomuraea basaltis]
MGTVVRWAVIVLIFVHGIIHLMGAAKGFGWAQVSELKEPIGLAGGIAWLVAAVLVVTATGVMAAGLRWWWLVAAVAAVVSQTMIVMSWGDAKAGTLANVVLLLAAGYGFVSSGPVSLEAEWHRRAERALAQPRESGGPVTEADLAGLPEPVADYVRASGAMGKPRVTDFYADIHGRIRSGPDEAWMSFTGKQLNTFGATPQRLFFITASKSGLPVDVLHVFDAGSATMRVKALSLVRIVDASGPDADRAETVTLFNDLVVLAPAALIDAPIRWSAVDDLRVRGAFTSGAHTVTADLIFNARHELVDFISDDRLRASADGKTFTRQRWSTPIRAFRHLHGRRAAVTGEARWHAPAPEGRFSYVEFHVDDIAYNTGHSATTGAPGAHERR